MSVIIYGASDDLIEVEGDVSEEFSHNGGDEVVLVVGGHGQLVLVSVFMDPSGDWSTSAKILRPGQRGKEASVTTIVRPGCEPGGDMGCQVFISKPVDVFKLDNAWA